MPIPFEGGCHCGAVRYICSEEPTTVVNCHCGDCHHPHRRGVDPHLETPDRWPRRAGHRAHSFYLMVRLAWVPNRINRMRAATSAEEGGRGPQPELKKRKKKKKNIYIYMAGAVWA